MSPLPSHELRHDWKRSEIQKIFDLSFPDLLYTSQSLHRKYFDPNAIQIATLLSLKTGGCPEDCAYCPQSAHHKDAEVKADKILSKKEIMKAAHVALDNGSTRFCMGAAWRELKDRDIEKVCSIIEDVKKLGMETCATLGMLTKNQAKKLKEAGLDYYNHNLDTSPEFYGHIISTRTYDDRLKTLENVREAGIHVCCGGIVGLGETSQDRIGLLQMLANMDKHPESVPINMLVKVKGTTLEDNKDVDPFDFVRMIATARILMPKSHVRLAAGRHQMTDTLQALCFLAGANSIFYGERLLTTKNACMERDHELLSRLGMYPSSSQQTQRDISSS